MSAFAEDADWELMWAPYDEATYQDVLKRLAPDDVVLEIGAGDLRLARRMARVARKVYAVEIQAELLERSEPSNEEARQENLVVVCADARTLPFPTDISAGVLLMRHCTHFQLYADKLKAAGCRMLITNARWRMGVEAVQLQAERESWQDFEIGWYACWCGAAGFKSGPIELLTSELDQIVHEVRACPRCSALRAE